MAAYRQRASFRGEVPVEAWLHRIAVNCALTVLRRRRVRWAEPLDATRHDRSAPAERAGDPDLATALQRLDPRTRAAVVLRYYVGLDYASIATILETSRGNVGSMLSRALDRLKQDLDGVEPLLVTDRGGDRGGRPWPLTTGWNASCRTVSTTGWIRSPVLTRAGATRLRRLPWPATALSGSRPVGSRALGF